MAFTTAPTENMVAIIILNWNNPTDTIACVKSLRNDLWKSKHIIVVDNGSTDQSVEQIQAQCQDIELIETGSNLGYAGGNNFGIKFALGLGYQWICLLNNDIEVTSEFLTSLMLVADEYPKAGIFSPSIVDGSTPDVVWAMGADIEKGTGEVYRVNEDMPIGVAQTMQPFKVRLAQGSAMLIRREVFETVGLLNETFFLYYEEADWSLQIGSFGFDILVVPQSLVVHHVSGTLGTASPTIEYYMVRNHHYFIQRNFRGTARLLMTGRWFFRNVKTLFAYTVKSHGGTRRVNRSARLLAVKHALLRRYGPASRLGSSIRLPT